MENNFRQYEALLGSAAEAAGSLPGHGGRRVFAGLDRRIDPGTGGRRLYQELLASIRNLMVNTGWPLEKAMEILGVPEMDRSKYADLLQKQ